MIEKVHKFERAVIFVLICMMIFVVSLATIRLGWVLIEEMLRPPFLLLNIDEMLTVFGFFLILLIGVELLESIKAYLKDDQIHVEVVFTVALIAVARKVITLDVTKVPSLALVGIGSIIIALAVGYFLIKKVHLKAGTPGVGPK